jgi:methanogenic corrinoid protein MtbC1
MIIIPTSILRKPDVDQEQPQFPIGVVERDTGIGRDTLRVWERRYGFPTPLRNHKGERMYSVAQLRRLQRIRRLLDQGMRPGKLLPLDEAGLAAMETSLQPVRVVPMDAAIGAILEASQSADIDRVASLLRQRYLEQGMQAFILHTLQPLLHQVGERWARGELQIFQEHFLSQQLTRFLHAESANLQQTARKPLVLLATLPGEEHGLGLLMVLAMLSSHGIASLNLGTQVPMDQICQAVNQYRADIVGITFSGAYPYSGIREHLQELRDSLAENVEIWIGGEGVRRLRKLPAGVHRFHSLQQLPL